MSGGIALECAVPVTHNFFSRAHASLVYQKVSQVVFSRWGAGLATLSIGIGACYGAVVAIAIGAIALTAVYARTNFFLLDIKDAASRGDVEKAKKLLDANPNHTALTPELIFSIFSKLIYAFSKAALPNLGFLLDHPIAKTCTKKLSSEDAAKLKILITYGVSNSEANACFARVLREWSHLLCNNTISYLYWFAATSNTNERALEIFLRSDRVQDIEVDLGTFSGDHENDACNKKVLEVLLPRSGFATINDPQLTSLKNALSQKSLTASAYWTTCARFVEVIGKEEEDDAISCINKLSTDNDLTPFWLNNAIALICKEGRANSLRVVIESIANRWAALPEKNLRLIEAAKQSLSDANGPTALFSNAFSEKRSS
ncbi:MAG TPA: hypothetical protein VGM34_03675 [Chlamydiales bacterium]|jgi:hypothetical protein